MHQLGKLRGRLFGLYLTSYGAWRLLSEPLRETPKVLGNFSVYQGLSLLLLLAGLWSLTRRLTLAPEVAAA